MKTPTPMSPSKTAPQLFTPLNAVQPRRENIVSISNNAGPSVSPAPSKKGK